MFKTPKHIQDEIDICIEELMLNQDSFNEIQPDKKAQEKGTNYHVRKELRLFEPTRYYIEEIKRFNYYGTEAVATTDRYFIETTSKTTFITHELWTTQKHK